MLLDEVTLVLGGQIDTPVNRELELVAGGDGVFQYLDTVRVGKAHEAALEDTLEARDELLVEHVVEELDVVEAVIQSPLDAVLDELLGKLHVIIDVVEGNFRLDHPEFRQVARRVGVLRAEGRAKRVDGAESRGSQFALQLAGDGEACLLAEEVVVVDDGTRLVLLDVGEIQRGNLEHLSGALAVRRGNQRRVKVVEAAVVKELVDGVRHVMPDAEDGAKGVGARAKVGDLAEELHRVAFLLERVGVRVSRTVDFDFGGLDLYRLALALRLDERPVHAEAGAGGDRLEVVVAQLLNIDDDLDIVDCRAIVEGDEAHLLAATAGTHPALDIDCRAEGVALEEVHNLCSFNSFHVYIH